MTNINPKTNIRYSCVYLNSLDPDTAQWLWDVAENLSEAQAYDELKNEIERDAESIEEEVRIAVAERDYAMLSNDRYMEDEVEAAYNRLGYDDRDDYIDTRLELESERIQIDEPTLAGTCEGVRYENWMTKEIWKEVIGHDLGDDVVGWVTPEQFAQLVSYLNERTKK